MDLDFLATIRETIDWIIKKYDDAKDKQLKKQLDEIANQIRHLANNKRAYLATLKKGLTSKQEEMDIFEINQALITAHGDTEKLNVLIEKFDLDKAKIPFSLKDALQKLTQQKQIKIEELKELVSKEGIKINDIEKIVSDLESFEQQWVELGTKIDNAFK